MPAATYNHQMVDAQGQNWTLVLSMVGEWALYRGGTKIGRLALTEADAAIDAADAAETGALAALQLLFDASRDVPTEIVQACRDGVGVWMVDE